MNIENSILNIEYSENRKQKPCFFWYIIALSQQAADALDVYLPNNGNKKSTYHYKPNPRPTPLHSSAPDYITGDFDIVGGWLWSFLTTLYEFGKAMFKTAGSFLDVAFTEGGFDPFLMWNNHEAWSEAWAEFDPTANTYSGRAWAAFDPTMKGNVTNNAFRIDFGGMLNTVPWELPQSLLGQQLSHIRNITGHVDNVEVGIGYALVNEDGDERWGCTLGPYINSSGIIDDYKSDPLFIHEFGHTIQSKLLGAGYLGKIAMPSLISAVFELAFGEDFHNHSEIWLEINANQFGQIFFEPDFRGDQNWENGYPTNFDEINPFWFPYFNPIIW